MATPARSSGLFSGLVLISVGLLVLLHNYAPGSARFFGHWWPLLIIFWGAVKLFERTAAGDLRERQRSRYRSEAGLVLTMVRWWRLWRWPTAPSGSLARFSSPAKSTVTH